MAVLIQEMVLSDLSFVLHTVNPINHRVQEVYAEIVVGLRVCIGGHPWRSLPNGMR